MEQKRTARGFASKARIGVAGAMLVSFACETLIGADFEDAHPGTGGEAGGGDCGSHVAGCGGEGGDDDSTATGGSGDRPGLGGASFSGRGGVGAGGSQGVAGKGGAGRTAVPAGGTSAGTQSGGSGQGGGDSAGMSGAGEGGAGAPSDDSVTPDGVVALGVNATDVATVSRGEGLLDVFALKDGLVAFHRFTGQWQPPEYLPVPEGGEAPPRVTGLAVTLNGPRLDLLGVRDDGRISHWFSSAGLGPLTWFGPYDVDVAGPALGSAGIGAVSWYNARLDAFWLSPSGNISHAWVFGNLWSGTESGDDESISYYLRPISPIRADSGVEVVAPIANRLDIFVVSASGRAVQHHWYDYNDGSGWGLPLAPNREEIPIVEEGPSAVTDLAVATTGGGLDLFVLVNEAPPTVHRLRLRGGAWLRTPARDALLVDRFRIELGASHLFDTASSVPPYLDLFGSDDEGRVWQAWFR